MQRGFAYLWTLFLVAAISAGMAVGAEVYGTAVKRERERELMFIGREYRDAIGHYFEAQMKAGQREYPSEFDDLLKDRRFAGMRRHLRKVYADPFTGSDDWGLVRVKGKIVGVYSLAPGVPLKQGGFDPEESSFANQESYAGWVFTYPPDLLLSADKTGKPVDESEESRL